MKALIFFELQYSPYVYLQASLVSWQLSIYKSLEYKHQDGISLSAFFYIVASNIYMWLTDPCNLNK